MTDKDVVKRPSHYTDHALEPIHVINSWELNFNLGNVIKYVARAGKKRGNTRLQDLQKAKQYLEFEIERHEHNTHYTNKKSHGDDPSQQSSNAANTPN